MSPDSPSGGKGLRTAIALVLAVVTALLYARAGGYEFVNFDDPSYVSQHPIVSQGLTSEGVDFAFTGPHSTNWHPLTTLSHMLDVELFGLDAGKHHLVSVGIHALNAALCFLALLALTRRLGVSAVVAALFALHPLRVESVAWISERKDVLSGTFFFLTLMAWARYARKPSVGAYVACAVLLALGLMAKQMLVTVPALLLVLDLLVLERRDKSLGALVVEKLPMLAVAGAVAALMWIAQSAGGTIGSLGALPLTDRILNAFAATLAYVRMSFAPVGLACFYPHPSIVSPDDDAALLVPAAIGVAMLLVVSAVAFTKRHSNGLFLAGWLWFLGMLVPVIGIVQIGSQAYADRYTYLPAIGLALAVVSAFDALARRNASLRKPLLALGALAAAGLALGTWNLLPSWHDTTTLNERALAVTEKNYVALNNLGLVYLEEEFDPAKAEDAFYAAIEINPYFREAVYNLALAYEGQGRTALATETLERLLTMDPGNVRASARLAILRGQSGDTAAAIEGWREVTKAEPENLRAWVALAELYLKTGEGIYAQQAAETAAELDDDDARIHLLLGKASELLRYPAEALQHYQRAAELDPTSAEAQFHIALLYANQGAFAEAKAAVQRALVLDDTYIDALIVLAKLLTFENANDEAKAMLARALRDSPEHAEANALNGMILMGDGDLEGAEAAFQAALRSSPEYDEALYNLGVLYEDTNREQLALEAYQRLLRSNIDSGFADGAARGVAWILATSPDAGLRDGPEAVRWAEFAKSRWGEPGDPTPSDVLAAALARSGKFEAAVAEQDLALGLARSQRQRDAFQRRRDLYAAERTFERAR